MEQGSVDFANLPVMRCSEMFTSCKGETIFMHLLSFQTKTIGTLHF